GEPRQCSGGELIIRVEESEKWSVDEAQAHVARGPETPRCFMTDAGEASVGVGRPSEDLARGIGRAVIDEDGTPARFGLRLQGGDSCRSEGCDVAARDDYRHDRVGGVRHPPSVW